MLAHGSALEIASAAEQREPQTMPSPAQAMSRQSRLEAPSPWVALPDDGPRYDRTVEGPGALPFQEAVKALARGQYAAARAGFDALATLDSASALIPPLKAFMAELTLLEDPTDHGRREAITQYRSISGAYPKNANSFRAIWRVGDLYAEMGWHQEAIVAYQYALSLDLPRHDADRSLLALGVILGKFERWAEAERAFETVRERAIDDRLVIRATFDQANALYIQRRKRDAVPLYDFLYQRWPNLLKKNPDALYQYADALIEAQELKRACEIDLLLYNLFPSHRHAGMALVRLGDSHRQLGLGTTAEAFYTAALTQYADMAAAVVARLRLSRQEQEIAVSAGDGFLQKKVEGMIRGSDNSYLEASKGEDIYKTIAIEHAGDILGSEALFYLAEHYESRGNAARGIKVYQDVTRRTGIFPDDPWPQTARLHLTSLLKPQLETALKDKKDVLAVTLFHSHGQAPEQHYIGTKTLLELADRHRRLGFPTEAVHLYQTLVKNRKATAFHEEALLGLGESYLDQRDPVAARNVFEKFRLQYPQSPRSPLVSRQLTEAMLEQGDNRSAIRVMRHWTKLHPQDTAQGWMSLTLARTLLEVQKREEAAAVFENALRNNILRDPQDVLLYADLLVQLNQPARAVDLYRLALKSEPDSATAEWARVQIALNLGVNNRKEGQLNAMAPDEKFTDPLFHRVARAVHIGLQAANPSEGE